MAVGGSLTTGRERSTAERRWLHLAPWRRWRDISRTVADAQTALGSGPGRPSFFISHRHADSGIADALRNWIFDATNNGVTVYQSSSATNAPLTGDPLDEALRQQLYESSVVLCPFTGHGPDWSWCMWECGLATHPLKADTRVVVLQFSEAIPSPYSHLLRIDARDERDITKFVTELLTDAGFVPGRRRALTGLPPDGPAVQKRASELFEALRRSGPPEPDEITESWSVLVLEFDIGDIEEAMAAGTQPEREGAICRLLRDPTKCDVVEGRRLARNMFGMTAFPERTPFAGLYEEWEEDNPGTTQWLDSVARQIALSARRRTPATDWVIVEGATSQLSIPVLCWTVRKPALRAIQFHLYFIPVKRVDPQTGGVELGFA